MLVKADSACVVIFNMQMDLIPLLHQGTQLLHDCRWLAEVARTFELPVIVIEHKKLGAPAQSLKEVAGQAPYLEKIHFDCTEHEHIAEAINRTGREQFVLAGAESHVCLLQSALGLRRMGKEVFVLSDVTSARNLPDHEQALQRLDRIGAQLLTKEMFFFECIRQSEFPNYVDIAMKFLDGRYIR